MKEYESSVQERQSLGKGESMKSPIDMNETEIRARFDFSRATRGRFAAQYKNGHTVALLDHDPDEEK